MIARFLPAVFIAAMAFIAPTATASAATGDMNEVLKINDTPTVIRIFQDNLAQQLGVDSDFFPYETLEGAADPVAARAAHKVPVVLNQIDGLRTQSALAPLVSLSINTLAFLDGDVDGDMATLDMNASDIEWVGKQTGTFAKKFGVVVSPADMATLRTTAVDEAAMPGDLLQALEFSAAFDAGYNAA